MQSLSQHDRMALSYLSAHSTLPNASRIAVRVAWYILLWTQRRKTRAHLRQLDDYMLEDIGLTRADAEGEAAKWFWRP